MNPLYKSDYITNPYISTTQASVLMNKQKTKWENCEILNKNNEPEHEFKWQNTIILNIVHTYFSYSSLEYF